MMFSRPITLRVLAAAAVLAAGAAVHPPAGAQTPGPAVSERFFNQGEYSEAARAFQSEVASRPGDLGLRLGYSICLLQIKDYSAAVAQLEAADRLAPGSRVIQALRESALNELRRREPVKAGGFAGGLRLESRGVASVDVSIMALAQAALLHPSSAPVANLLGDAHQLAGNTAEAEKWYRKAINLAPTWTKPVIGLGIALVESDPPRSAALLEDALRRDPDNAQVKLWLGDAYQRLGQPQAALQQYREAGKEPAVTADAKVRTANALLRDAQIDDANKWFVDAQKEDPGNAAAAVGVAQTFGLKNDAEKTSKAVSQAQELTADSSRQQQAAVGLNVGQALMSVQQLPSAAANFQNAAALEPDMQMAYEQMARAFKQQGVLEQNNRIYAERLQSTPAHLPTMRYLVEGYGAAGETEKQIFVLDRLSKVDEAHRWLWNMRRAAALWSKGEREKALQSWLSSVDLGYPTRTYQIARSIAAQKYASQFAWARLAEMTDAKTAQHLLFALADIAGRPADAIAHLDRVIAADPENPTLYGQKAVILRQLGDETGAKLATEQQVSLTLQPPAPPPAAVPAAPARE